MTFPGKTACMWSSNESNKKATTSAMPCRLEDFEGKGDAALKAFAPRLHSAAGILRRAGFWDEAMNRGGSSPNLLKLTRTESNTPPEVTHNSQT